MTGASLADFYRGRRVLVTGGLGFIGSNLTHALVALGCRGVRVIDSLDPEAGGNAGNLVGLSDVEVHQLDIANPAARPLLDGVDVVFNLAGRAGHVASMRSPEDNLRANCSAQLAFLDACKARGNALRLVFTSTRQVYGRPRRLPVDETHPIDPPDINAAHKLAGESYHRILGRVTGASTMCLRLTNVYGPRQSLRGPLLGFLPTFLSRALQDQTIDLFDGGKARRDLLYVDDVIDALLRAGAAEAAADEILNIGSAEASTLRQVAERMIALVGRGRLADVPLPEERRSVDIGDYLTDARRAEQLLGWRATTSLDDGLLRTIAFYRDPR